MTAKERVSRVSVVHGCFSERGDSIISMGAIASEAARKLTSSLGQSHDQPGCARARISLVC